jgi:hypothetical protein
MKAWIAAHDQRSDAGDAEPHTGWLHRRPDHRQFLIAAAVVNRNYIKSAIVSANPQKRAK